MEQSILTAVFLPLALAFIMMGMGITLRVEDFGRVLKAPKAITLGLSAQLILLPLAGFALVKLFGLTGGLALGLMILAACPGGPTSNLISHLAKGDLALSISLTAVSSVVTIATIPLIVNLSIGYFGEEGSVMLPVMQTIIQIMGVTIVPVSIGMFIRSRNPRLTKMAERPVKFASALFFTLIMVAAILQERENLVEFMILTGPAALSLNLLTMGIGYSLALIFALPVRQRMSITVESGIQNGTMGIMIAATLLQNSVATIPIAIYSLLMFVTAIGVIAAGNRLVKD
ncbi:MAG: bile acid:sodium symporter family protein [Balneolia bacterium]|nr:bile acid:sodium symporter family protein [Balneolia bacterium]